MARDDEFESDISHYRQRRRLLVAKNINFKTSRADFKKACRDALSKPATVKFFWRKPEKPWWQHVGSAMLGFEIRTDCRRAQQELQNFRLKGRDIKIELANKVAVSSTNLPVSHLLLNLANTMRSLPQDGRLILPQPQPRPALLLPTPATPPPLPQLLVW